MWHRKRSFAFASSLRSNICCMNGKTMDEMAKHECQKNLVEKMRENSIADTFRFGLYFLPFSNSFDMCFFVLTCLFLVQLNRRLTPNENKTETVYRQFSSSYFYDFICVLLNCFFSSFDSLKTQFYFSFCSKQKNVIKYWHFERSERRQTTAHMHTWPIDSEQNN